MNKGKIILTFYFKNGCVIKKNMNLSEISEKKAVELVDSLLKLQDDLKTFLVLQQKISRLLQKDLL